MEFDVPNDLIELIGLSCCEAKLIGDELILSFGKKINYQCPELRDSFHSEWQVSSGTSSWRLINSNEILCGNYDEDVSCLLNNLVTRTIIDIKQTSQFDVCLYFNNEYQVCFIAQSRRGAYLSIIAPEKKYIAFLPGDKWVSMSSETPLELSKEEKIYYKHSEQCYKRWGEVVNVVSENQCLSCGYFIPLRGSFYFGDFGLCSNKLSPFDGKVVAMSSGCKVWGRNIEMCHERKDG